MMKTHPDNVVPYMVVSAIVLSSSTCVLACFGTLLGMPVVWIMSRSHSIEDSAIENQDQVCRRDCTWPLSLLACACAGGARTGVRAGWISTASPRPD